MVWLIAALALILASFGFVLLHGAPYLPTLTKQVDTALDLVDLRPGQVLLELGCGDGKVMIAAARRGLHVIGYELNPLLALVARLRTLRYGKQVQVIWGDFWKRQWPRADGIFTFLLPRYMQRLDRQIATDATKPVTLVSFAFEIPGRQPATTKDGVYLYVYR